MGKTCKKSLTTIIVGVFLIVDFYPQLQMEDKRKTRLPLSVGFAGYDSQQGYLVKGLLPAASMCSFYGHSGAGNQSC